MIAGLGVGATLLLTDAGSEARSARSIESKENHAPIMSSPREWQPSWIIVSSTDAGYRSLRTTAGLHSAELLSATRSSDVIAAVQRVKGVRALTNKLELRDSPGKVLALQPA